MGNKNSQDISFEKFQSLIKVNDFDITCTTDEECQLMYKTRIKEYLDTLFTILSADDDNLEHTRLELENKGVIVNFTDKNRVIEELGAKTIVNIMLQNGVKNITLDNFENAKNVFLQYINLE